MGDQPDQEGAPENDAATRPEAETAPEPASLAAALVAPPETTHEQTCERRARLAEARLTEVLAGFRTLKTETEAHKTRAARTIERRFEKRHEQLLLKFIDILDNFDRALDAAEQTYAGAPLIEGLILVRTQLLQTLQQEGLERVPVLGLPFDPAVSEAMATAPVRDSDQDGLVVKEYLRGYRLFGRLARPSRVVVGRYSVEASETPAETPPGTPAATPSDAAAEQQTPEEAIAVDDHTESLRPTPVDEGDGDLPSAVTPADDDGEGKATTPVVTPVEDEGPSLEEIVARAEARQALFNEAQGDGEDAAKETSEESEEEA